MSPELYSYLTYLFGQQCGVNADWQNYAWMLSSGLPNQTNGALYLLENEEDNSFVIIRQLFDSEDEASTEDIINFEDEAALRAWLKTRRATLIEKDGQIFPNLCPKSAPSIP
jgi:hypothetical protein